MESPIQTPEYVIQTFLQEFKPVAEKFIVIQETAATAEKSTKAFVWHPGVYVWIKDNRVIKVGRHLENSRKRALEHLRDNTQFEEFQMVDYRDWEDALLLLFNLIEPSNSHWVAAAEMYLETVLEPAIRSKRLG
jgi:hypothetical protein